MFRITEPRINNVQVGSDLSFTGEPKLALVTRLHVVVAW